MKIEIQNKIFFEEVEKRLAQGEQVMLRVRGCSMMPLLRDGRDSVVIRAVRDEDVKIGKILFFRYHGSWVMHRLKSIDGENLIFAGDGNYRKLEHATRDELVATVITVCRASGSEWDCEGRLWRVLSFAWLSLPPFVRRVILAINRRM